MPPKARVPAPIDRPLSRAYLRQFSGWSTAYPPGLSDPASLREMSNVMTRRDGSVSVRPGLRYLSYATPPTETEPGVALAEKIVGTHEAFFLNDGTKAYLFAVREDDDTVGFRVLVLAGTGSQVRHLTDAGVEFEIPQGEAALNFTAATTYVKYLQIDNKIFALSNAGETMRLFRVGSTKSARMLSALERPDWNVADKLTVVQPDAAWPGFGGTTVTRTNLVLDPSFEGDLHSWTVSSSNHGLDRVSTVPPVVGSYVGQMKLKPSRTNFATRPLGNVPLYGITGWTPNESGTTVVASGNYMDVSSPSGSSKRFARSELLPVPVTTFLRLGWDYVIPGGSDLAVALQFYSSSLALLSQSSTYSYGGTGVGRRDTSFSVPSGTAYVRVLLGVVATSGTRTISYKNVTLTTDSNTAPIDGDGTNYSWEGIANASRSVQYVPANLTIKSAVLAPVEAGKAYTLSAYFRAETVARNLYVAINWYDSAGTNFASEISATSADVVDTWGRHSVTGTAPAGAVNAQAYLHYTEAIPRDELHYVDAVLFEQASSVGAYFDGDNASSSTATYTWSSLPHGSTSVETSFPAVTAPPSAETPTANTLISSDATKNIYNFGFYYTYSNEVGESAPSQVTVVRAQRPWVGWRWETASATGEPSGTKTSDPTAAADQLVAFVPQSVFNAVLAQGATRMNLYMMTWSDQDPLPVEGVCVETKDLVASTTYGVGGWCRATPALPATDAATSQVPSASTRRNYSDPSRGGQGLVASDRMVLVYDPTAQAVIRWTSNQQGAYTDFTASKGGGFKTLTSGNLFIPACVKLWQNPQSVDTLTILCMGIDGYSTGYYMAPAQVASQSEATNIMGFEETTATPGTTSPYGCEVANNALFHPIDEQLMKSTANNYNITHTSMTEAIRNRWSPLLNKQHIVSSFHDNRLYYIVHNPTGALLEDGCNGNELWVLDISKEGGNSWSRWEIQAHALRKIERGGRTYMSVVRPDGIYYLDPLYDRDDVVDPDTLEVGTAFIPWALLTNTQGANRAHDAWCHLAQANIVVGNFLGSMRYGVRGRDVHGKPVEISKVLRDGGTDTLGVDTWDLEDYLLIQKQMKEWFFFAESVADEDGVVQHSTGQVCLVQYRYAPISVNVGYEYGSVETFEYGRAGNAVDARTTDNGVPMPYINTGRP